MNRHPVILAQLGDLLPEGPRLPETRLRADLGIPVSQYISLAAMIEEAWGIAIDRRRAPTWRTLADVCDSIADSYALEPA